MTARKTGATLALIAIVPLVFAAFTRGWMTASGDEGTASFGLLSGEFCPGERCERVSWSEVLAQSRGDDRAKLVTYGGYAAVGGTLVLALLLALAGIQALRKSHGGLLAPILVVIGALIGGAGALGSLVRLQEQVERSFRQNLEPAWGYSAFVFLAGAGLALVAGVLMMIRSRGAAAAARSGA